jgi:hypothetical protein
MPCHRLPPVAGHFFCTNSALRSFLLPRWELQGVCMGKATT